MVRATQNILGMTAYARMVQVKRRTRGDLRAGVMFAVAATVLWPATGSAQGWQIAPELGVYDGGAALINQGTLDNPASINGKRMEGSLALGVTGWYWLTGHLGVRAGLEFTPSPTAVTDSLGLSDLPSGVWLFNTELVATLRPIRAENTVYLGLGGGIVSRRGGEWQYSSGPTVPAAVGSLGVSFPLRPLWAPRPHRPAHTVLLLEFSTYVSRTGFNQGPPFGNSPPVTHFDYVLNVMIAYSLGGHK